MLIKSYHLVKQECWHFLTRCLLIHRFHGLSERYSGQLEIMDKMGGDVISIDGMHRPIDSRKEECQNAHLDKACRLGMTAGFRRNGEGKIGLDLCLLLVRKLPGAFLQSMDMYSWVQVFQHQLKACLFQ